MKPLLLICALLAACGRVTPPPSLEPFCPGGPTPPSTPADACARLEHVPETVHFHVASCSDPGCGNAHNPPTGGPHCASPLACDAFPTAQGRCQWVHNLEHGHAALLYNCPDGCPEIVAGLEQIRDAAPRGSNGRPRVLVTADPLLPTRVGAVVWGWSFTGDSVDSDAISCLMTHQDEEAPEACLACQ